MSLLITEGLGVSTGGGSVLDGPTGTLPLEMSMTKSSHNLELEVVDQQQLVTMVLATYTADVTSEDPQEMVIVRGGDLTVDVTVQQFWVLMTYSGSR